VRQPFIVSFSPFLPPSIVSVFAPRTPGTNEVCSRGHATVTVMRRKKKSVL
jgi:hypothetical protein